MKRKPVSAAMLTLLLIVLSAFSFTIQPAEGSGTITITAQGLIVPDDGRITKDALNITYSFTTNITDYIVIQRSNIIVDGNNYTLQSPVSGSGNGFYLSGISNVTIKNTTIKNFYIGIDLLSSSQCTVTGNNITANSNWAVYLTTSSYNNVSENTISTNQAGIYVESSSNYNNIYGNSMNAIYTIGIQLSESSNHNDIYRNNLTNVYAGISFSGCSNNTVSLNSVANGNYGVNLAWGSHYNLIFKNNMTGNTERGLYLHLSNNNSVVENNIRANERYGLHIINATNNSIYHNSFEDNLYQVYVQMPEFYPSVNVWDDGYPSGGNYWSNYTGVDNYRGTYQNEVGSDGVGDTDHVIDTNNVDHYPLTKPYGGPHDIGIPLMHLSKTVVGQGYYCTITITLKIINYGITVNDETFDLNIDVNTVPLASKTITLSSRNSTTLIFTWDTTGLAKGSYTVSAHITQVPDETYTTDNVATVIVRITIPGDVNGDWIIDVHDTYLVGRAYSSVPASSNWNSNADINNSNEVDNADLTILAENYGKTDP